MKQHTLLFAALGAAILVACNPPPATTDAGVDAGTGGGSAQNDSGVTDAGSGGGTGDAGTMDAGTPDAGAVTTVRVHYPAGARSLSMRGSTGPFNWNSGLAMTKGANDTWTLTFDNLQGELEFKPLLDDVTWSRGPNYRVQGGATVDVYPHFTQVAGQWSRRWPNFSSTLLGNTRGVWVYLPPTAIENSTARFPVIYMHDGQNLFDPNYAFGGQTWKVAEALDTAAEDGSFAEAIVVGPENAGAARIDEYTPTVDSTYGGGNSTLYLRMLIEELKPKVDAELPVKTGREDTYLVGSSLGGLVSSWAGVQRPDVFGHIGAFSPSTWWDNLVLLTFVGQTQAAPNRPLSVYVDCGTSGDGQAETDQLAAAYRTAGYVGGQTLKYVVEPGGTHSEPSWARRLPAALQFLLGPGR